MQKRVGTNKYYVLIYNIYYQKLPVTIARASLSGTLEAGLWRSIALRQNPSYPFSSILTSCASMIFKKRETIEQSRNLVGTGILFNISF